MNRKSFYRWLLIALMALVLAACATTDEERVDDDEGLTDEELAELERDRASEARGVEGRRSLEGSELEELLNDPNSPLSRRTVYFEFDSSEIRERDVSILEAHAAFLSDHPDQRIAVEGHTDERGSPEYNLALGERRAIAVKRALVLYGASDDQIRVTSYGEENPAALGSDEESWSRNRRGELVYR
ncbi:peptidoglycan-associated lipoprotein Pal [Methylonatrum kenyense]|uniref:peptidoglycan-associated lipoprotein Pal n=1 Tax=Methylonatrum kenyense TaxID=455253 RepID=UPI0020C0183B|nr:peptidoglycan-associated lipoprotein Pal [Methylonatrum kenyense]MCK8516172.1 peptidoglycan-associated lipoprotein Pal [Methylonatrum kenyense]